MDFYKMLIESYLKYIDDRGYIPPDEFIKIGFILATYHMQPEVFIKADSIIYKSPDEFYILCGKYLYFNNNIIKEYVFTNKVELTDFENAALKFSQYNFITN